MNNKGQFSIIAALLVAVILIATVIVTYSTIRNDQISNQPQMLSAVDETNLAIKQILGFTVGYYNSILQVTGNRSYAEKLALNYLSSGLVNVGNMHPEWGTSFNLTKSGLSAYWFTRSSYSTGNLTVAYNLTELGIYNMTYQTSSKLSVNVLNSATINQARLSVTKDQGEPVIDLGKSNFKFYGYQYSNSSWKLVSPPTEPTSYANGTYAVDIPSGVDPYSYVVQVQDPRGLVVIASSYSRYVCTLTWNSTVYTNSNDYIVVELLHNGTMCWLGQNLQMTTQAIPIPPIAVKAIHVNQTRNGINREVPFQVEDWNNKYQVPAGLTSNLTVFSNRQMIVFLVYRNVSTVTIWWDGHDTSVQTAYAYTNRYFTNDNTGTGVLTNGILSLSTSSWLTSTSGTSSVQASFMRINAKTPTYGSNLAYIIHHGIVRDIIHQEAEWPDGISEYRYVDNLNNSYIQWSTSGSTPYLRDTDGDYIYTNVDNRLEGWFGFQNISGPINPGSVKLQFECRVENGGNEYFQFQLYDGTTTYGYYNVTSLPGSYDYKEYDVTNILNTWQKVNNAKIRLRFKFNSGSSSTVYIRRARLYVTTCPNVYSQIVITLPANVTYYTYQLHLTFVQSQLNRGMIDLCPIKLTIPAGSPQTENGTVGGYPIIYNNTGTFYNYSVSTWAHHWSQFISGTKGAGIMFTNASNRKLYVFDSIAGSKVGGLKVDSSARTIEVLPVASGSVSFTYQLEVTWYGAVATFDGTKPIYRLESGNKRGLWILVEYPPKVAVTTQG